MKIGEHYDIRLIDAADWRKLARACALEEDRVLAAIKTMASGLPDHISAVSSQALAEGLPAGVIAPLAQHLTAHARTCLAKITQSRSPGSPRRRNSARS